METALCRSQTSVIASRGFGSVRCSSFETISQNLMSANNIKPVVEEKGRGIKVMRELELVRRRAIGEDVQGVIRKMMNNPYERNKIERLVYNENRRLS